MGNYTINDIGNKKGHIFTKDKKYYLRHDAGFDYWCDIIGIKENKNIVIGHNLGHYSYDYCFRSDLKDCVEKLNQLISKRKEN